MSPSSRVIRDYNFVIEILQDVLRQGPHQQTTIIACTTQEQFVRQLTGGINHTHNNSHPATQDTTQQVPEIPASQEDLEHDAEAHEHNQHHHHHISTHHLLHPTLHLLATSRNVQMAFCPTITTLRAYLSVFQAGLTASSPEPPRKARLIVIDVIALHHGTSEFTLQGLSRTLAGLASTAYHTGMDLDLIECRDIFDETNPNRGSALWDADVPLLSGSVKVSAAGAGWAGRTIPIKKLAQRWYDI